MNSTKLPSGITFISEEGVFAADFMRDFTSEDVDVALKEAGFTREEAREHYVFDMGTKSFFDVRWK